MTCIVGLIHKEKAYLGFDSIATNGYTKYTLKQPKAFKKGDFLIGSAGTIRFNQLLQYSLNIPTHHTNISDMEYLCTDFTKAIITCLQENKFAYVSQERVYGEFALFAYHNKLYRLEENLQIVSITEHFTALGSGEQYALASLKTLERYKIPPRAKLLRALETTAYFSETVAKPFHVISL